MLNAKIPTDRKFPSFNPSNGGGGTLSVAKKAEGDQWEPMRIIGQGMVWTESP